MPLPPPTRWKRISKAEALEKGLDYYFDEKKAEHAVGFFEKFLIHSKGQFAGKSFTLLPWQKEEVIEELFGWCRCDTDTRRYRVGYIELPKKNFWPPLALAGGGKPTGSPLSSLASACT